MFVRSILILGALAATFHLSSALKCYNCSSTTDSSCGATFGYKKDSDAARAIVIDCVGDYVACRKIEHTDTHKAETYVQRSCWTFNNNGTVKEKFYKCGDYSFGEVCYCKDDSEFPCNNQVRVTPTLATFLLGLLPLGLYL